MKVKKKKKAGKSFNSKKEWNKNHHFSWIHHRAEITGQMSSLKSKESIHTLTPPPCIPPGQVSPLAEYERKESR